eukprot:CAMPEP_0204846554 /NCGR_PEP_ID=MMETSP1347-20130617/2075_1 /ASSEMBLY_ACC=CAM_ASM_000690 /TAXON_ID=215587 /ORGANISM="Aplanochytrium stocchinoi, Strain GSBS06" /LENGTH=468 /DNA_ID=CAMNT_0051987165 /DNA_START=63 /DNA_END=1469 /DNA_ORIENTATION=+
MPSEEMYKKMLSVSPLSMTMARDTDLKKSEHASTPRPPTSMSVSPGLQVPMVEKGLSNEVIVPSVTIPNVSNAEVTGKIRKGCFGPNDSLKDYSLLHKHQIPQGLDTKYNKPTVTLKKTKLKPKSTKRKAVNQVAKKTATITGKKRKKSPPKRLQSTKPTSDERSSKQKPRYWSKQDDEYLRQAVEKYKENWSKVAAVVPNRSYKECSQRWTRVLAPGLKKGKWSAQEDNKLLRLVNEQLNGDPSKNINWSIVTQNYQERSSKQCRERWINYLDPRLKKSEWTRDEDEILLRLSAQFPKKWARMAREIPGRTENMVKVRWKSLVRKQPSLNSTAKSKTQSSKRSQNGSSKKAPGGSNKCQRANTIKGTIITKKLKGNNPLRKVHASRTPKPNTQTKNMNYSQPKQMESMRSNFYNTATAYPLPTFQEQKAREGYPENNLWVDQQAPLFNDFDFLVNSNDDDFFNAFTS